MDVGRHGAGAAGWSARADRTPRDGPSDLPWEVALLHLGTQITPTVGSSENPSEPQIICRLELANRIILAPKAFHTANEGALGSDVSDYYRSRTAGGAPLVIAEATAIDHPSVCDNALLLHFHGDEAVDGWREVVCQVHEVGAEIVPELWVELLLDAPSHADLVPTEGR